MPLTFCWQLDRWANGGSSIRDYLVKANVSLQAKQTGNSIFVSSRCCATQNDAPNETGGTLLGITDGTSNTILVAEVAGRPAVYIFGKPAGTTRVPSWAAYNGMIPINLDGWLADGSGPWGPCAINCSNAHEVYSFHTGGANLSFADGRVKFVNANVSIRVMAALVTRAGGETETLTD